MAELRDSELYFQFTKKPQGSWLNKQLQNYLTRGFKYAEIQAIKKQLSGDIVQVGNTTKLPDGSLIIGGKIKGASQ